MTLKEFDAIRKYLPEDIEISIGESAYGDYKIEEWGNHDGRFNMKCSVCGYTTDDIPSSTVIVEGTLCPKCKKSIYRKGKKQ